MRRRQIGGILHGADAGARPRRHEGGRRDERPASERIVRELIDVDQAGAADHVLHAAAPVDAREDREHLDLARRPRAPVRVPAFRRAGHEAVVEVEEERFAEPGAGRDHRGVAVRLRDPLLQDRQLGRFEYRHGMRHGLEVVEDMDAPEAGRRGDRRSVHQPGHVREPRDLVGHRAGDAERRRLDRARLDAVPLEELPDHRHQIVVLERDELADFDPPGTLRRPREESEQRLGSAYVGRQQHPHIIFY
jgi:hypothetical protein